MPELSSTPKDDMLCNKYKKREIVFEYYRGFELRTLKIILEYSFSGFVLKIDKNHKELRFDIYLCKVHPETKSEINISEVERFRTFYGRGFNLILLSPSDDQEYE